MVHMFRFMVARQVDPVSELWQLYRVVAEHRTDVLPDWQYAAMLGLGRALGGGREVAQALAVLALLGSRASRLPAICLKVADVPLTWRNISKPAIRLDSCTSRGSVLRAPDNRATPRCSTSLSIPLSLRSPPPPNASTGDT